MRAEISAFVKNYASDMCLSIMYMCMCMLVMCCSHIAFYSLR